MTEMILRNRKPTRKQGYDYSTPGYYFITTNVKDRLPWFGEITNGQITLNEYGEIVNSCWHDLPNHYSNIELDEYVIMPDHFHGIICIKSGHENNNVFCRTGGTNSQRREGVQTLPYKMDTPSVHSKTGLPEIIRAFKTFSSRRINELSNNNGIFQWQSSFHDRIIRDNPELEHIRQYIWDNPKNV